MRRELDKYRTPSWMTEAFKESFPDVRGDILIDPCAGDCRMAAALASRFECAVTNDIDLDEPTKEHFDATLGAFWDDLECIRVRRPDGQVGVSVEILNPGAPSQNLTSVPGADIFITASGDRRVAHSPAEVATPFRARGLYGAAMLGALRRFGCGLACLGKRNWFLITGESHED